MESRPLSIALFSDSALPVLNGVSVSIDALVKELRNRGHSVHLFTSHHPGHKDEDPNVHRFAALRTPWSRNYPLAVPPFYPLLHEFRRHEFDLIHTHTPWTVGFVGLRWAESHELPIVATYHTHYDKYAYYVPIAPKRYVRYKIAKHTNYYYSRVRQVITPSDASKRWLQRHSVKTPISVIPTGIPTPKRITREEARNRLGIPEHHKIAIYVGRIAEEKNVGLLLKAMVTAFQLDPDLRFWLVGDGPARSKYQTMARDLGIGDRIKFVGFVKRENVDPYYAAADVFTFASMTETQGLVVVEAMTHGLPALVVQGGGAGNAICHGENGLLIKNDSETMASKIIEVTSNPELMKTMSEKARQQSAEYTIPRMTDRILDVYRQAMSPEYLEGQPR